MEPTQSKYLVRRGDTLERIARMQYGTATMWREIARANHLKRDRILIGMELKLPRRGVMHQRAEHQVPSSTMGAPPPIPPFSAPAPHDSQMSHGKQHYVGDLSALALMFPAVKVKKSLQISLPQVTALYTVEGELECEGVFQRKGTMSTIELSDGGVSYSGKLSSDYDTAFSKLTAGASLKVDVIHPLNGVVFSSALTSGLKYGDKVFLSTSVAPKPPNQVVYSMSPREIESETPDKQYLFKGNISFKFTVTFREKPSTSEAAQPVTSNAIYWIGGGVLTVVVVVSVVVCPPTAIGWEALEATMGLGLVGAKVAR